MDAQCQCSVWVSGQGFSANSKEISAHLSERAFWSLTASSSIMNFRISFVAPLHLLPHVLICCLPLSDLCGGTSTRRSQILVRHVLHVLLLSLTVKHSDHSFLLRYRWVFGYL